jgi:hypothetical protein
MEYIKQLNSIYYTAPHVSTDVRSSSGSNFVFKTYWGRNTFLSQYVLNTYCELKITWNRSKHVVLYNKLKLGVFGRIRLDFCYKQHNEMTSFKVTHRQSVRYQKYMTLEMFSGRKCGRGQGFESVHEERVMSFIGERPYEQTIKNVDR